MAKLPRLDCGAALGELRRMALEFPEFRDAVQHIAQLGLPIYVHDVDGAAAIAAGDGVFTYKISERVYARLSEVGAVRDEHG